MNEWHFCVLSFLLSPLTPLHGRLVAPDMTFSVAGYSVAIANHSVKAWVDVLGGQEMWRNLRL